MRDINETLSVICHKVLDIKLVVGVEKEHNKLWKNMVGPLKVSLDGDDNFREEEEGKNFFISSIQDKEFIDINLIKKTMNSLSSACLDKFNIFC